MSFKIKIPPDCVQVKINSSTDELDNFKLHVKTHMIFPMQDWFVQHIGHVPALFATRAGYFVRVDNADLIIQFNLTWYEECSVTRY